ncbi:MAG: NAD(P)H-dependent oxidoreductase [Bacteroidota bacterium]|nr:NAD(P)H-dependent oxidoreductase [Bacteroidota bacterium]
MANISILSSSVRIGRKSHRVALYLQHYIKENKLAESEIIDLRDYKFPVFDERLRLQKNPTEMMIQFAEQIKLSDGIIIVTPEYNGSIPASLKNVIDLLYDEWHHKPIAISTVSSGLFGGSQALVTLQFVLWKMHAWTVPATLPIASVTEVFDKEGVAVDQDIVDNLASIFINEILWCIEANKRMTESPVLTNTLQY